MPTLYNCRHDGDQYRITKFTDQMEVESSYLVDPTACECPAFDKRGRCKHQEMLPYFINRKAVGSGEMFDWERGGWVRMFEDPEPEQVIDAGPSTEDQTAFVEAVLAAEGRGIPPLPKGVTMIGLEDPALLHNTIAEAVGEPALTPAPRKFRRR